MVPIRKSLFGGTAAVTAAGLVDTLNGEGPFTVLAPNDDAFGDVPADVLTDLLDDAAAGGSLLADILGMHVIADADGCQRRMMGSGFVTADDF